MSAAATDEDLRDSYGRGMNNASEEYKLPVDAKERNRLNLQHLMWKAMIGGLYPPHAEDVISSALSPEPLFGREEFHAAVLDVGSGSGIWAVEMALRHPHVKVLGIDLTLSKPAEVPRNCTFVCGDAMDGLDEYAGKFDMVHCRSVLSHVSDGRRLKNNMSRCLRHGGLMLIADGCMNTLNGLADLYPIADVAPAANNQGKSWMARWFYEWSTRVLALSDGITKRISGDRISQCIREEFKSSLLFRDEKIYWCPIGWSSPDIPNGREVSELMVRNTIEMLEASAPRLISYGISHEDVDDWRRRAEAEVLDPNYHLTLRWHVVWGEKKGSGSEAELKI